MRRAGHVAVRCGAAGPAPRSQEPGSQEPGSHLRGRQAAWKALQATRGWHQQHSAAPSLPNTQPGVGPSAQAGRRAARSPEVGGGVAQGADAVGLSMAASHIQLGRRHIHACRSSPTVEKERGSLEGGVWTERGVLTGGRGARMSGPAHLSRGRPPPQARPPRSSPARCRSRGPAPCSGVGGAGGGRAGM